MFYIILPDKNIEGYMQETIPRMGHLLLELELMSFLNLRAHDLGIV